MGFGRCPIGIFDAGYVSTIYSSSILYVFFFEIGLGESNLIPLRFIRMYVLLTRMTFGGDMTGGTGNCVSWNLF